MSSQNAAYKRFCLLIACLLVGWCLAFPAAGTAAEDAPKRSKGQMVYVPIYSHVYAGDREKPVYLAATLSIRNVDLKGSITLTRADYYDSDGRLIKNYIQAPVTLKAMSSTRFVISESDKIGGSGANFLVQWSASQSVNPPLMESVMISTRSALGISFTSRGRVIQPE